MFLSASNTFSQVNEDFSWVKKEQIKKVQFTSTEESNRKEFEEIFEYDSNGALVRHELTEGWFKYVKEFNPQGFIELDAELLRLESKLFFDTADVTYHQYEGDRIKKETMRGFNIMKEDSTKKLSYEAVHKWAYQPRIIIAKYHYHDYSLGLIESYEEISFLNINGTDSIVYFLTGTGDTVNVEIYEYEYDKQGREYKIIQKRISNDNKSVYEKTNRYRGKSNKLRTEEYVSYHLDESSKYITRMYKYSFNGSVKSITKITENGKKIKEKYNPPKPKYDLKSRLKKAKKTDKIVNIVYHYN